MILNFPTQTIRSPHPGRKESLIPVSTLKASLVIHSLGNEESDLSQLTRGQNGLTDAMGVLGGPRRNAFIHSLIHSLIHLLIHSFQKI